MESNPVEKLEELQLSKINSAYLVNLTLNNLWENFFRHFKAIKYLDANNDLDCIWTILGGEKGIANSPIEKDYNEINKKLQNYAPLKNNIETRGFSGVNPNDLKKLSEQRSLMLTKALFLRRLQNTQGKGTAYLNEDEEGFD